MSILENLPDKERPEAREVNSGYESSESNLKPNANYLRNHHEVSIL